MNFFHRIKNDKGLTNSVSFIMIIGFVMTLLVAFVDVGLYFNTKNQMFSAAENGARSVALYGGVDTEVRNLRGRPGYTPIDVVWDSIPAKIKSNRKTVIVEKGGIQCHPVRGRIKAGDVVWCEVTYVYNGLAGKFGIFNLGNLAKGAVNSSTTVRGSSVSEVTIE